MTRGNQRELARAKNAKKQEQLKKSQGSKAEGVSTDKRMERDADIMRKKQEKAAELKKQQEAGGGQNSKIVKTDPLKS